jgi:hypothetical protein
MCNQSVGLISRILEEKGISTVCILTRLDVAETVKPPRTLLVKFPYGSPLGHPHEKASQAGVLMEAINLLESIDQSGKVVKSRYKWK